MLEDLVVTTNTFVDEVESAKEHIVAESQVMRDVIVFVRRIAMSDANYILIEGENGTGKDVIAQMLHYEGNRRAGPFLAINCAAIPDSLLESELFGHEKGAFTDAHAQKRGLFELADKGTLFLDEIVELPMLLQAKLLRVLESQRFRRLGGLQDINTDLRIVSATNKNLQQAVFGGAFRQDLYYRLNVIQVVLPPLRERPVDILPLARFFLDKYNERFKRHVEGISSEAQSQLLAHNWPGNVRELRNAMEHAMVLEESSYVQPSSLPITVRGTGCCLSECNNGLPATLDSTAMSLLGQERRLLVHALAKTENNQTQAARLLGITRDTLRYKMKKFNLR